MSPYTEMSTNSLRTMHLVAPDAQTTHWGGQRVMFALCTTPCTRVFPYGMHAPMCKRCEKKAAKLNGTES